MHVLTNLQGRYRDNWSFFYPDVDGILFVVDAADKERLPVVVEVLEEMAKHPGLAKREIPFVILGNKNDLNDAVDAKSLEKFLNVDNLKKINGTMKFKF